MTTLLLISHLIARSSYTPSGVYDTHVLLPRSTTLNASFPRCKLLHLVRHAEGTHNVASSQHMGPRDVDHHPLSARVSGTTFWDPPLTALGKRQAIALRRSILAEGDRVARGGAADVDVLLRGDRMESLCGRAGGAGARDVAAKAQMKALCSAFDAHNPPASDTHAASILGAIGEALEGDDGTEDDEGVPTSVRGVGVKGSDRDNRRVARISRLFPNVWDGGRFPLDLVIVSSLTRTAQTALLALGIPTTPKRDEFGAQLPRKILRRGDPAFVASEGVRERVSWYTCDGRRTVSELRYDYPSIDWSDIPAGSDSMFKKKESQLDERACRRRALRFLDRVAHLPDGVDRIAVVSHQHFLKYVLAPFHEEIGKKELTRSFANAEMRTFWLCPRNAVVERVATGRGGGVERGSERDGDEL